ncbi:MAG TPA: ATP-binding protein, partial [Chloroflexota bacterium]|nr:ATP-binding protein [Chloroflexota bacterium]
ELREQVGALEQARAEIARHAEETRRAQRRVTESEERLRREVAELLLGRVQTRLVIASYKLAEYGPQALRGPEEAAALVAAVKEEIDALCEQDIRRASHLLHPGVIKMGLLPALHMLAERVEPALTVHVVAARDVVFLDDPLENRLDERLRLAAYRIAEEAVTNVLRHAGAQRLWIELTVAAGHLTLSVRDDGRGVDTTSLRHGLGLSSVDGRVRELSGTWSIEGAPSAGTTLTARLPLSGDSG